VATDTTAVGKSLTVDVVYNGADIVDAAALLGLSVDAVIAAHTGQLWVAAFNGFLPGFAYCVGENHVLDVARRAAPRTAVPANSVGLAGEFSAIYPKESPGGWRLIGHTAARLWELGRRPPALINPGDQVRYIAVRELLQMSDPSHPCTVPEEVPNHTGTSLHPADSRLEIVSPDWLSPVEDAGRPDLSECALDVSKALDQAAVVRGGTPVGLVTSSSPVVGSYLEVVSPGWLSLIEDRGRPGLLGSAVGVSGALDQAALARANTALGNSLDAAGVETLGGLELVAHGAVSVAVVPPGEDAIVQQLADGETLRVPQPRYGLRSYVAAAGGIASPSVLGSRSTDILSGLGPEQLNVGTLLPIGSGSAGTGLTNFRPANFSLSETLTLRITLGPREDWLSAKALASLTEQRWEVSNAANRIGLRLIGQPLQLANTTELPSEGIQPGAIQLPPNGLPVVFLRDHPTTGGYPVVGVVVRADLDLLAQVRPGAHIQFVVPVY
jgi:biotin-dependent carboxylase-like uncharacterized protein